MTTLKKKEECIANFKPQQKVWRNTPVVSFSSKRQFVSPQSPEKDPLIYPEKKKLQPESKLIMEFKSHQETPTERLGQQALILQLKDLKKIMT